MGNSKVIFGDETVIDLTDDTVTPAKMAKGTTAHDAAGNLIIGTAEEVNIVQEKGDSETDIMSQAAVSAELNKQSEEIASLKKNGTGGGGSLEETGVEAGTYGGYDSSVPAYNIPNVRVDEYGRVTEASNSVLPKASAESDGYISAEDYVRLTSVPSYGATNDGKLIILAGETESQYPRYWSYYSATDVLEFPIVAPYGVYNDGTYDMMIPLEYRIEASNSKGNYYYSIYPYIKEAIEYDITCYIKTNVSGMSIITM